MTKTIHTTVAAAAALAGALALAAPAAQAVEGAVQYPHGAEGFYAGALPPPGTYLLAYGIYYQGTLQDSNGNDVRTPGGDTVELTVRAVAPRIVHMTDIEILGAQWGMHAIVPLFSNTIDIGGANDTNTGLGDITIDPLILAWHHPNLHYAFGLDINIPTGEYSRTAPLGNNIGANYWSIEPLFALTWMPADGWEVNAKFMYNYKFENDDTNYHSGDEIHVDYTVGKTFADNWTAGIGGYYVNQIEDDQLNGVDVGNRAHVLAIGPQLKYQAGATSFIAKWHHEVFAENAFQGDRFILKMVTPF